MRTFLQTHMLLNSSGFSFLCSSSVPYRCTIHLCLHCSLCLQFLEQIFVFEIEYCSLSAVIYVMAVFVSVYFRPHSCCTPFSGLDCRSLGGKNHVSSLNYLSIICSSLIQCLTHREYLMYYSNCVNLCYISLSFIYIYIYTL